MLAQVSSGLAEATDALARQTADELVPGMTDAETRLSLCEHLAIDFDPQCDPDSYLDAVAPHAGKLADVVAETGSPGEAAITSLAGVAEEINDSIRRMSRTEARLCTLASGLDNPVAKAAIIGAAALKIDPWLAACGASGVLVREALQAEKSTGSGLLQKIPSVIVRLLEKVGVYAPGTFAVHDLRRRLRK